MAPTARERLVTSAIALFRERGIAGTGITELIKRSDTARRSLYLAFPGGKAQLAEESTREAGRAIGSVIAGLAGNSPTESLDAFVDIWKSTVTAGDFAAGCPIVAAALAGAAAPAAVTAAGEAFGHWTEQITTQLRSAGMAADTAQSLASTAVAAVEGAVILAIASRSTRPLDDVRGHLSELVRLHLP